MTASDHFIPIARPSMGEDELSALREVVESGWLTQGPWVRKFETAFAGRHDVSHAVATTSCTTALHLALLALDVGPGDEVIVPAFTWVATANAVVHCGAKPVLVDVCADTFNIDPGAAAAARTPRTKAAIAVHLFGLCADMDALAAALPGVPLIEDAACATGALYKGRSAGKLGALACFSLHPRKSITCGEGGVITTDHEPLAARVNVLRNHGATISEETRHGSSRPYDLPDFPVHGFNYRMTDLQAAVAFVQLGKLDRFLEERRALADRYDMLLADSNWLVRPARPAPKEHALQSYVVRVDEKDAPISARALLERLHAHGIGARAGTHNIAGLTVYRKNFGARPEDVPIAAALESQTIALPLHNCMRMEDVDRVAATLLATG